MAWIIGVILEYVTSGSGLKVNDKRVYAILYSIKYTVLVVSVVIFSRAIYYGNESLEITL